MTHNDCKFRENLKRDLDSFVLSQSARFPDNESLIIDLHCHDRNSDVPDEMLGRILHWPETWVATDELREVLARNGATALTITNHNNARSCYELLDRGIDVLVGAEFTCNVPDFDVYVHVLAYGFTPEQEARLLALRGDLYRFLTYAREHDLVTVLAHPLYFYSTCRVPTLPLLEKLTLLFDNFEVLNGQRDTWQNMLVVTWLQGLTEQSVADMARRVKIPANAYCRRPVHKAMTGGSDDHMALFVGTTASRVHVPDLANRLKNNLRSTLVFDALKSGSVAPYGNYTGEEKLAASFLDYFCQIVKNAGDPGLVRLLLHQGSVRQKIWAFVIANGMSELRRHKYTSRFIDAAHEALHGKHVGFMQKYSFAKEYRPVVKQLDQIATAQRDGHPSMENQLATSIPEIFHELNLVLATRIKAKADHYQKEHGEGPRLGPQQLIESLELPADLRTLLGGESDARIANGVSNVDLRTLSEGLPFPALAALVIGGSTYASTKVLFANRPLLDDFSQAIGRYQHPRRVLWLTDTMFDNNGVASVLKLMHGEAVRRALPIDFAVCHAGATPDEHLRVLKPVVEFPLPYYEHQPIRGFDIMELQRLFINGGYDRIVCSTEGPMGLAALYLKNAFSVPAFFYVHTDWMDFAHRTLKLDARNADRVRRLLRAFYRSFDGVFALNSDHLEWLASDAMGIERVRIRQTAHWPDRRFCPHKVARSAAFPGVHDDERVVLFVGRLSEEKGVLELPAIIDRVRSRVPNARLVVVGTGPAEDRLRTMVPGAVFLSWVDTDRLAHIYPAADVLVLPSRFDTFGCVVLEALASGLPAVAYRAKGPKDIIINGVCGFTVEDQTQLADAVTLILQDKRLHDGLRSRAIERAKDYHPDRIVNEMLEHVGLGISVHGSLVERLAARREHCDANDLAAWHTEPEKAVNESLQHEPQA